MFEVIAARQSVLVQLDKSDRAQLRFGEVQFVAVGDAELVAQDPGVEVEVGIEAHRP